MPLHLRHVADTDVGDGSQVSSAYARLCCRARRKYGHLSCGDTVYRRVYRRQHVRQEVRSADASSTGTGGGADHRREGASKYLQNEVLELPVPY